MVASKETLYAAVDVGTTKVCTLVAKVSSEGEMRVVAIGHAASEGMKKGMVINPEELKTTVKSSVDDARSMLGRPLPPAFVGVTGSHLRAMNTAASITRKAKAQSTVSQRDVDRLLQSSRPDQKARSQVVHVIPRGYRVDGLQGVRNPVGLSGRRITVESHVVLGDTVSLANVARVVHSAGVPVRGLVMEHIASSEAVLTIEDREAGVVLVDIGGGTSDIAIYANGVLHHTAAVPVAGQQLTSDVSIGLGIPLSVAEEVKLRHGSAVTDGVDPKELMEVRLDGASESKRFSQLWLNTLLRDRAIELVNLIMHVVRARGWSRMPQAGLVLTGGSANLRGLVEVAQEYAACPVRLGVPSQALGLPQELAETSFATGVGLLLWGTRHQRASAISPRVSLSPLVLQRLREWVSRLSFRRPTEVRV